MNLLKEKIKFKIWKVKNDLWLRKSRYVNKVVNKHIHTRLPNGIKNLHKIYAKHMKENRGINTMYFIFHNLCAIKFRDDWVEYREKRNEEIKKINPIFRKIFNINFIEPEFNFPCEIIFSHKIDGKKYIELVEMGSMFKLSEENFDKELNMNTISVKLEDKCSEDKITKYTYDEIFG